MIIQDNLYLKKNIHIIKMIIILNRSAYFGCYYLELNRSDP